MASVAISVVPTKSSGSSEAFDAPERIRSMQTPEIVIALCGPMGTPLHEVAEAFKSLLLGNDFDYKKVDIIKLSDVIRKLKGLPETATTSELIQAGNDLRQAHGNAVLVQHAIKKIYLERQGLSSPPDQPELQFDGQPEAAAIQPAPSVRVCHIIDSIKNVDELRVLRQVYGDMLHVVGVYAPIELRIERLLRKVNSAPAIHQLINRDSGEELSHGQSVQETFPQSDFFLRADTNTDAQLINRCCRRPKTDPLVRPVPTEN